MADTKYFVPRRPPAHTNLKDGIADYLRELIFSGQVEPGDKIDQDEIATQMEVSKLPVREALILLEAEGLIVSMPRRGAFVAPLKPIDIQDHYRIFASVSGLAAERAATSLTSSDLDDLAAVLDRLEREPDASLQEELNHEFHRRINRTGGSRRLLSAIHSLSQTMPSRFYEFASGWGDVANEQHRAIMDALRKRDTDAAREAMTTHLVSGGDFAIQRLKDQGFWQ